MNEDRIAGKVQNLGGKAQEGVGKFAGDAKMQAEGKINQLEGSVQELYGQAKDGAKAAAQTVRDGAVTFEEAFRNVIETRPYTAAVTALVLGWAVGRMGRGKD